MTSLRQHYLLDALGLAPRWQLRHDPNPPPMVSLEPETQALVAPACPSACLTLEQSVAGCTACDLASSRTQTVFGRGNPHARWLLVGEAPGEQEDRQGLPFVGPAGQLLDAMLRSLGLNPATDVYIANVLKCRPPRNRNPQANEITACQPFLAQQIALMQPQLILALGSFAAQSLLNTETPIGKLRGQCHDYQGIPLIASYHPAYLLRTLRDKAKAWQDLCLAMRTVAAK